MPARKSPQKKTAENGTKGKIAPVVQTVDEDMDEVEEMEEVELSSDEEDDEDDVQLLVMKRPPITERIIEEVEITDDIEITGTGGGGVNLTEKSGFVKEYIETEGLGMLLCKDYGLVLFHLESVWINNTMMDPAKTKAKLPAGTEVTFYDRTFKGEEYKDLSEDKVIHQAVAVWVGDTRPDNVLKKIADEEYKKKLEEHRATFILYLKGEVFLRAALVRVKGEISGYLNDTMGIIEYKDDKEKKINILFHTEDVKVFKKDLRELGKPAKAVLPVGCLVSVDARRVHVVGAKNIEYQAIVVLAGLWPKTPHPTLLPGGPGSVCPSYDIPRGPHTFYYMELALEGKLTRKLNMFKELSSKTRGQLNFDWHNCHYIQNKEQFIEWKQRLGGNFLKGVRRTTQGKRECLDVFKSVQAEEEDIRTEKAPKVLQKTVQERTWYTPEAWEHGGLRLKEEVKDEMEEGLEPTAAKRIKKESAK